MSVDDAMSAFVAEGWFRCRPAADGYADFLAKVADIDDTEFLQDFHVPEVFVFPPRTEFYGHELYKNGMLILQDKATCLAAYLLAPPPGSTVLDMCAAPGLKTTQLAAMMHNDGTLFAAEKSQPRYRTLVEFAERHGAAISPIHGDASTLTSATCAGVEYVLVDPSCSGSGMPRHTAHDFEPGRVAKLAGFQVILLERALMNFPTVKKVVYSTCSNYVEENEQVVEKVLKTVNPDPANPNFKLADVLVDSWLSRGSDEYECGPKCIYAREDVDLTTGFFMAVFERIGNGTFEVQVKRKRIRGKKMRGMVHKESNGHLNGKKETSLEEEKEVTTETVSEDVTEDRTDDGEVRKKKKKLKRKEEAEIDDASMVVQEEEEIVRKKKKKSKRKEEEGTVSKEEIDNISMVMEVEEVDKKKKKKRKKMDQETSKDDESMEEDGKEARRKEKKRRKREKLEQSTENEELVVNAGAVKRKKHKKDKNVEEQE